MEQVNGTRPTGRRRNGTTSRGSKGGTLRCAGRLLAVGAAAPGLLAWASAAWACSSAAQMGRISPTAALSDQELTVTGTYFVHDVEVRWAGLNGPVLGRAIGPTFSMRITVPEVAPGVYGVTAIGRNPDGSIAGQSSSTLKVLAPAATPNDQTPGTVQVDTGPVDTSPTIRPILPGGTTPSGGTATPGSPPAASGGTAGVQRPTPSGRIGNGPASVVAPSSPQPGPLGQVSPGADVASRGLAGAPAPAISGGSGPPAAAAADLAPLPDASDLWADVSGSHAFPSLLDTEGAGSRSKQAAKGPVVLLSGGIVLLFAAVLAGATRRRAVKASSLRN